MALVVVDPGVGPTLTVTSNRVIAITFATIGTTAAICLVTKPQSLQPPQRVMVGALSDEHGKSAETETAGRQESLPQWR